MLGGIKKSENMSIEFPMMIICFIVCAGVYLVFWLWIIAPIVLLFLWCINKMRKVEW